MLSIRNWGKRGKVTLLKEISLGIVLELISLLALIGIFILLGLLFLKGQGFDQNNFDRLVGDISVLPEGDSKLVTVSIDSNYYVAGWNYKQGMLAQGQCKWNKFSDIQRPISCDGMCLCLCKRAGEYCGEAKCVSDPAIGNFDAFGTTDGCGYVYLASRDNQFAIRIKRENDVMTLEMVNPNPPFPMPNVFTGGCFEGGTLIMMADGSLKPIPEVAVGDKVISYDESSNEWIEAAVINMFVHPAETRDMLLINSKIKVTPNHHLLSGGEWVAAGELEAGDLLFGPEGYVKIESIERYSDSVYVYDIRVEAPTGTLPGFGRNYVAGGIVAHNKFL